jgi:hypothetical protein
MKWLVTYKAKQNNKWCKFEKVIIADSKTQAIRFADIWQPLIINVQKLN